MSDTNAIMNTYGRLPISFSHGEGVYLFDEQGNKYLDAISGIGVNALGHSHPAVSSAIKAQADKLLHTSNLYGVEKQSQLAERLTAISGMQNVFFCNSGAEANEAAIKIARKYGHQKQIDNAKIIVMDNAFHGRTLATLSASGNKKIHEGFEPLVDSFVRVAFDDVKAIESLSQSKDIVAILVEPVQGEGGVHVPAEGYLAALRTLCDQNDWLLMLDEVQTGNGRTGQYFAYMHENILPDVLLTAKGLGNGLPIGACLTKGKASEILQPGNHGSTFGGNPLVCAGALAVVDTIDTDKLSDNAKQMSDYLVSTLKEAFAANNHIKDIRSKGLMIGIELDQPCQELVNNIRANGALVNVTAGNTIRLLPPLIINQQQCDELLSALIPAVNEFTGV